MNTDQDHEIPKNLMPKLQLPVKRPRLHIVSSRSSRLDNSRSQDGSRNRSELDTSGMNQSKLEMVHSKLDPRLMITAVTKNVLHLETLELANPEPVIKSENLNRENASPGSMHQSIYRSPLTFNNNLTSPGKVVVIDSSKTKDEVKAMILNSYLQKERESSNSNSPSERFLAFGQNKKGEFNLENHMKRVAIESPYNPQTSSKIVHGKAFFPGTFEGNEHQSGINQSDFDEGVSLNKVSAKFISPQFSPNEDVKNFGKAETFGGEKRKEHLFKDHTPESEDLPAEFHKPKRRKQKSSSSKKKSHENRHTLYGTTNSRSSLKLPVASMSEGQSPISQTKLQEIEKDKSVSENLANLYSKAYPSQVTYVAFAGDSGLQARVDTSNGNLLAIYQGEFDEGQPNGHGSLKYSPSEKFEGQWMLGLAHGHGALHTAGYKYDGDFQDGVFSGKGKLEIKGKGVYIGHFKEGKFHGQGKFTWDQQKMVYIGGWRHGAFHGKGLMVWPDGRKFYGEYQKGLKHGKGLCIFASGAHKSGQWFRGKLLVNEG